MPPSSEARYCLGLGLSAVADIGGAIALIDEGLARHGLQRGDLACLATIDSRRDHPVVAALAAHFGLHFRFFNAARLEVETPRLKTPSAALFARIGCHGVAEAAALAAAGKDASLIAEKMTGRKVTVAIAV